jgi:hypothetical protein
VERIAAVVLLVVVMVTQWQLVATRERLARADTRADSIAADAAIDAIRRDSAWSATVASTRRDLAQAISERDSTSAALVARLDDAGIQIAMLTDLSARAQGEVESLAQRATVLTDSLTALADTVERWEGEIDDGLLTATWRFDLPPARHTLTYGVTIPGELVVSETGDGRTVVLARSTHPRASLDIGEVVVSEPEKYEQPVAWRRYLWAALAGAIAWEMAR